MPASRKKELPNPKKQNIIPPDMDYRYLKESKKYPLEPKKTNYSPVNAWWFSECAFLAYTHPGFARMVYKLAGFDMFRFFHGVGTECMVSWNNRVVIVAFRGTELKSRSVLHEIQTDLNTIPVPFESGGMVHKGFLKGLEEIWDGPEGLRSFLDERLNEKPHRPLWITGHSLGGALAALCFARIPDAKGLYLFGAPRVGDKDFKKLFQGRSVWRIENARDPVPLVPPDIPSMKFNFVDLGTLKFIDNDGEILDKRPEFILNDQKKKYLEAKEILDMRIKKINKALTTTKLNREGSKNIIGKIHEQLHITRKEWKDSFDLFFKDFGLNTDKHQPIFYAVKLWNALIQK
ncbi:MAG: lipase family protein [Spirochaetaceae bacterium]|nr:lipase family protein [Spirochaetaceae bacterium]